MPGSNTENTQASSGAAVYAWNPRRSEIPRSLQRLLPVTVGRRLNNFGDLLGPLIVREILRARGIEAPDLRPRAVEQTLFSVGSVLHMAQDGDVVWGSGVNGKQPADEHKFTSLDVRAVRGPLTREFLISRDVSVPAVFGDPALLLPQLMPEWAELASKKRYEITVIPNLNDIDTCRHEVGFVSPRTRLARCLARIAQSEFVTGSSLHAIIVADALTVPARLVQSSTENRFKYDDYFLGSGRAPQSSAGTVKEAIALGPHEPLAFDPKPLLDSFPIDLWSPGNLATITSLKNVE